MTDPDDQDHPRAPMIGIIIGFTAVSAGIIGVAIGSLLPC